MIYIRKKPKGFGKNQQIEGNFNDNQKAILIEDLTTDGASKVVFIEVLRKFNINVSDIFVIFYYDIFKDTLPKLSKNKINLHYLCTWKDILDAARMGKYFEREILDEVESFLNNPLDWQK